MEKQTPPCFGMDSDFVEIGLLCACSAEFASAFVDTWVREAKEAIDARDAPEILGVAAESA